MGCLFAIPSVTVSGRIRRVIIVGIVLLILGGWILLQRHNGNLVYFIVTSESMDPVIKIGDRVLMIRAAHYKIGEIVVLDEPGHPNQRIVKRIIALEGDSVAVDEDEIVNLTHPLPVWGSAPQSLDGAPKTWSIKKGEVFVAGDNRAVSKDSRHFGPLPLASIRGVVRYRVKSTLQWVPIH